MSSTQVSTAQTLSPVCPKYMECKAPAAPTWPLKTKDMGKIRWTQLNTSSTSRCRLKRCSTSRTRDLQTLTTTAFITISSNNSSSSHQTHMICTKTIIISYRARERRITCRNHNIYPLGKIILGVQMHSK